MPETTPDEATAAWVDACVDHRDALAHHREALARRDEARLAYVAARDAADEAWQAVNRAHDRKMDARSARVRDDEARNV